jgi:hypothetical protein
MLLVSKVAVGCDYDSEMGTPFLLIPVRASEIQDVPLLNVCIGIIQFEVLTGEVRGFHARGNHDATVVPQLSAA